jgi:hypothetical protein
MQKPVLKTLILYLLPLGMISCSSSIKVAKINDQNGVYGKTSSPVIIGLIWNKNMLTAAEEGRLGFSGPAPDEGKESLIPVQLESTGEGTKSQIVMIIPEEGPGIHKYKLIENESPFEAIMKATLDPKNGQVMIEEKGKKVLQYNYQTVYEKDVVRIAGEKIGKPDSYPVTGIYLEEYVKEHPGVKKDTLVSTSIYAVPRSDYIHPLYGLDGEMLTRDWPDGGHPHHRGIFWAWPEVEYGTQRADIYALQRLFARPTGNIEYINGPVFAQITAENLWKWEDTEPIVREHVVIRVYHATLTGRIVDLTIKLEALKDGITIATRNTDSYGGFNLRMMTPDSQSISYFTDQPGSEPLRAWSDFNGVFQGAESRSGLMVLQSKDNPEYPGAWVKYPDLAWVQPTFPTPGTRYPLGTDKPLILHYRLMIHAGGKPEELFSKNMWDAFNGTMTTPNTSKKEGK